MPAKVHSGGDLFLGDTIQEKTRTLLGWNDEHCGSTTTVEFAQNATGSSSSSSSSSSGGNLCRRLLHGNNSCSNRHYPYFIPNAGRLRRNSVGSSSTCSLSSSSSSSSASTEYSQPSPSYSITSYESLSPEPLVSSCTASDCYSSAHTTTIPASPTAPATTTFRSPEREAQVFERLRQLVPVLPTDRSAYQILIETVSQVMDLEHQLEQLNEQTNNAKNSLRLEQSLNSETENCVFPDDLKTVDVTAFKRLLCSDSTDDETEKANFCYVS